MESGIGSRANERDLYKHTAHRVMIGIGKRRNEHEHERKNERRRTRRTATARSGKWKRFAARCRPLFIISARQHAQSAGSAVTWHACQIGAKFESLGIRNLLASGDSSWLSCRRPTSWLVAAAPLRPSSSTCSVLQKIQLCFTQVKYASVSTRLIKSACIWQNFLEIISALLN